MGPVPRCRCLPENANHVALPISSFGALMISDQPTEPADHTKRHQNPRGKPNKPAHVSGYLIRGTKSTKITDPNTNSWLFKSASMPPMATSTSTLVFCI